MGAAHAFSPGELSAQSRLNILLGGMGRAGPLVAFTPYIQADCSLVINQESI